MSQFDKRNISMMMDLYEMTMANCYFTEQDEEAKVVFDVFYRKNPDQGGFAIFAGLEQIIEYIRDLHFTPDDICYLRSLGIFEPDFLEYLDNGFSDFLQGISDNPLKKEYLIPTIVGDMLTKDEVSVQVLETSDHWIGITYREDIAKAQEGFARMTADGTYPQKLWG